MSNFPDTIPLGTEKVFNLFCKVVEKANDDNTIDKMYDALKAAPVFEFDREEAGRIQDVVRELPKAEMVLPPLMPFPEVVLVDDFGAVLFWAATDYELGELKVPADSEAEMLATGGTEMVSLLRRVNAAVFMAADREGARLPDGDWQLLAGHVNITEPVGGSRLAFMSEIASCGGTLESPYAKGRTCLASTLPAHLQRLVTKTFGDSVHTALDQLCYVDLPRHHLIEKAPRRLRENKPHVRLLPKLRDRPTIRCIEPEKLRIQYERKEGGVPRGTQSPHARRGYTRYLTSEHWKAKRWERIRIRPTWVGDREWEAGAYRFRVVARKNDQQEATCPRDS